MRGKRVCGSVLDALDAEITPLVVLLVMVAVLVVILVVVVVLVVFVFAPVPSVVTTSRC